MNSISSITSSISLLPQVRMNGGHITSFCSLVKPEIITNDLGKKVDSEHRDTFHHKMYISLLVIMQ